MVNLSKNDKFSTFILWLFNSNICILLSIVFLAILIISGEATYVSFTPFSDFKSLGKPYTNKEVVDCSPSVFCKISKNEKEEIELIAFCLESSSSL